MRMIVIPLTLLACGGYEPPPSAMAADLNAHRAFDASESEAILELANTADFDILYLVLDLDFRTANTITEERPFTTFAELDETPFVQASALATMLEFAQQPKVVEGITAASYTAANVLWFANFAEPNELEPVLDTRAVDRILEDRPFTHLSQLDAIPYVGPVAFERLRFTSACAFGLVLHDDEHAHLSDAIEGSGHVRICDEQELWWDAEITGELVIEGTGASRLSIAALDVAVDGNLTLRGLHLQAESFSSRGAWVDFEDVTFESPAQTTLSGSLVNIRNSTIADSASWRISSTEMHLDDSMLTRATGPALIMSSSLLEIRGGAVLDNPDGGIRMKLGSVFATTLSVEDTDFGQGADDNGTFDVLTDHGYHDLTGVQSAWIELQNLW